MPDEPDQEAISKVLGSKMTPLAQRPEFGKKINLPDQPSEHEPLTDAESEPVFWYRTEERAFAPGIADGWPTIIPAPHTPHGRLIRVEGSPEAEIERLQRELEEAKNGWFIPSLKRANATIARLRDALDEIRIHPGCQETEFMDTDFRQGMQDGHVACREIAKKALAETEPSEHEKAKAKGEPDDNL